MTFSFEVTVQGLAGAEQVRCPHLVLRGGSSVGAHRCESGVEHLRAGVDCVVHSGSRPLCGCVWGASGVVPGAVVGSPPGSSHLFTGISVHLPQGAAVDAKAQESMGYGRLIVKALGERWEGGTPSVHISPLTRAHTHTHTHTLQAIGPAPLT